MENLSSTIGFFYNIIPGLLFLFINHNIIQLLYLQVLTISVDTENNPTPIIALLVLSLFIGFFFQSLTKLARDFFLNRIIFNYIKCKDEERYNSAVKKLNQIEKDKIRDVVDVFYSMHNYLSSNSKDRLPEYFSGRFAFWSNIFFALLISLTIFSFSVQVKLFNLERVETFWLFIVSLVYSTTMSLIYIENMYNSVLKTFLLSSTSNGKF